MKQRQSLADVPEITVRDRSNLDDYLYEPNSKYQDKEAEKVTINTHITVLITYSCLTTLTLCLWMVKAVSSLG